MDLLKDLNSAQKEAVTFKKGPLLIVAGAGTGKTTVITRRVAWLISQKLAQPEEILALTFTDKAAAEMEERVDQLLPYGYVNTWVSTFHAFGERVLKEYALEIGLPNDFRLLNSSEQWMLMRNNIYRFNLDYYRPLSNPAKFIHALLQHFSRAKDELVTPEEYLNYAQSKQLDTDHEEIDATEIARLKEVADAYHVYQQLLLENNALDFGDLINYTLQLFKKRPKVLQEFRKKFKYILVDEFQDTNLAQYELVKLLSAPENNLTVVGDDDQAIYKFRGASISNILHFKKDYPDAQDIFLNENYRSYQNILDTAYNFIQLNNPYRLEIALKNEKAGLSKKLAAFRKGKAEVECLTYHTAEDEAEGVVKKILALSSEKKVAFGEIAILVRANSSASIFLQTLRRCKIPFDYVANRGLYKTQIILDIVNYLKLLDNYHESEALYSVLTAEPFLLPHADLVIFSQYAKQKTVSLYSAIRAPINATLSDNGRAVLDKFLTLLDKHSVLAHTKSIVELYVQIVKDLGMEQRVEHPALAREAQYLASFYKRIQRFEMDSDNHSLNAFLSYFNLEQESGEEGQLPADLEDGPDTVKVITVHAAKGLEWRYVFVVQLIDRRFPSTERREPIELPVELIKETLPEGDVHLQEERRLFYVAMTRARDGLFLTHAKDYLGKTTRKPSAFLFELGFVKPEEIKAKKSKGEAVKIPNIVVAKSVPAHYHIPDSFSFSSVSSFLKCPLEYKFQHLLKIPTAGAGQLSFGITIHRTLELFLKLWQERLRGAQLDLFGKKQKKTEPPKFSELLALYENNWIDDWYIDAHSKQEYKEKRGPAQLKNFYENFVANLPRPKYLESRFKIGIGPYKFVGKIDRIDEKDSGNIIVDYKTGAVSPEKLNKVDRDQLIVYQIAAQEFLKEKISGATYWYLEPNQFSEQFLADEKTIEDLKERYESIIENIITAIKNDSFKEADRLAPSHECKYRNFERNAT